MSEKIYSQDASGEAKEVFLNKLKKRVESGEFDKELTIPFVNRGTLWKVIYGKLTDKLESGSTPVLSDKEIYDIIKDLKEASAYTFHIFKENGFFENDKDGKIVLSKKGKIALRQVPLL